MPQRQHPVQAPAAFAPGFTLSPLQTRQLLVAGLGGLLLMGCTHLLLGTGLPWGVTLLVGVLLGGGFGLWTLVIGRADQLRARAQARAGRHAQLLALAETHDGTLTVPVVVRGLGVSFEEARQELDLLAAQGFVTLEFEPKTQTTLYRMG